MKEDIDVILRNYNFKFDGNRKKQSGQHRFLGWPGAQRRRGAFLLQPAQQRNHDPQVAPQPISIRAATFLFHEDIDPVSDFDPDNDNRDAELESLFAGNVRGVVGAAFFRIYRQGDILRQGAIGGR